MDTDKMTKWAGALLALWLVGMVMLVTSVLVGRWLF